MYTISRHILCMMQPGRLHDSMLCTILFLHTICPLSTVLAHSSHFVILRATRLVSLSRLHYLGYPRRFPRAMPRTLNKE